MEIFNVITLNNRDYVILGLETWDNKDYVLLEEINSAEELVNNRLIGRLVVKNGEDAVVLVTDEASLEYKNVSRLFFETFVNEFNE